MDDQLGELLAERYGAPADGEATECGARPEDEGTEIARRRRVLWLGTKEDREEVAER